MRRSVPALLLVATALVLPGCGPSGAGEGRQLEDALIEAINDELAREAPIVQLRSVTCRRQPIGRKFTCAVFLGIQSDVFRVRYAARVGEDGCWTARASQVSVLRAGPNTRPPETMNRASDLSGCFE